MAGGGGILLLAIQNSEFKIQNCRPDSLFSRDSGRQFLILSLVLQCRER
ncbi:hypothetical protein HMPREF9136_0599 [Prevotella dentalis DSM 3688]|uniref:Uncharacterized protein n=1 Tax=Prevotella dentalis (strain ATCC 49559 / DSM 3688 / JCM 13448 / NCTC 12043 / ES 2772) TaxID=908937 RepID=F9D171_PREDD|nr:hypothetical protein HMPREF9136_0599 [Prevotella dentalis DSM 3688]